MGPALADLKRGPGFIALVSLDGVLTASLKVLAGIIVFECSTSDEQTPLECLKN